jgi:O-antigen ligase
LKGLLFTLVAAYGGALVALSRPMIGLLAYTCFAIIRPESMWPWSVPSGNYSRVVALGMLAGWAGAGFGNRELGRARGVVAALAGFMAWSTLMAVPAPNQEVAWKFVGDMFRIILPCLVGITLINSVADLRQLAWTVAVSSGYVAFEFNLSYLQGYNRIREEGFATMDNNSVAIMLVACAGLAFILGLESDRWWRKAVAFVSAALLAHAVLLSNSRGGMLALIVTGVVTLVLIPKSPGRLGIFAIALLVGLRMAGAEVVERFTTIFVGEGQRDFSARSRLDLWADCLDVMKNRPLFGVGPDHWPLVAHEYGWPAGKEAHTLWLQLGAELGLPGLLLLVSYYGLCIARLIPLAAGSRAIADPWLLALARITLASLSGFVVCSQFVSLEKLEVPYLVALIGAGVLKLASTPPDEAESDDRDDDAAPDEARET